MTEQLMPCPFCGCIAVSGDDRVLCAKCGIETYSVGPCSQDEAIAMWNTRAADERINGLMQTIESQNQTAQAMVKRLEAQAAEIEELREALEALFCAALNAPPFERMSDKVTWQDAMHKARAAIAGDSTKGKTR